jgi:hypothetical protein
MSHTIAGIITMFDICCNNSMIDLWWGEYILIHDICTFYGLFNKTFNGSDYIASNYGMFCELCIGKSDGSSCALYYLEFRRRDIAVHIATVYGLDD